MRKSISIVTTLVVMLLVCIGNAHAQTADLERMRDAAIADIQKYEGEIHKSNATIGKCENIIRLARQKGNAEVERIAGSALEKARQAKLKNEKLRNSAAVRKKRVEDALARETKGNTVPLFRDPLTQKNDPEHAWISQILEEAKYARMDSSELDLLAGQYPGNEEIQKSLCSLKARQEAMAKLEDEVRKFNEHEGYLNIHESQAKREVQRALAELAALGIPGAECLDELLNREQSAGKAIGERAEGVATEKVIDFVVAMFPDLGRAAVGLKHIEMAKNLCKVYEAVDAAGDHYTYAAEARAYIQTARADGNILDKWSGMRAQALDESAQLYRLVQKEQNMNRSSP